MGGSSCSGSYAGDGTHGNAQSTGTPGHAETSKNVANQMAQSGKYETVHLNQKLSTITGDAAAGGQQPDVAGLKPGGAVDTVEVPSKTQTTAQMDAKGAAMQKKLESIGRPGGKAYTVPIGGKMSGAGSVNALITVAVGGYIFMQNPGVQGAKDAAAGMVEGVLCGLMGGCSSTASGNAADGLAR